MRYYIFVDRNNSPHPHFLAHEFVTAELAWAKCPDLTNYVLAIGSPEELDKYKQTNGKIKHTGVTFTKGKKK